MSQISEEVLVYNALVSYSNCILNDVAIEALRRPDRNALVNGVAVEIIIIPAGKVWMNDVTVETIHNNYRNACLETVVVEELNNSTTMAAHIDCLAVEMLVRPGYDPEVAALVNNPHYFI